MIGHPTPLVSPGSASLAKSFNQQPTNQGIKMHIQNKFTLNQRVWHVSKGGAFTNIITAIKSATSDTKTDISYVMVDGTEHVEQDLHSNLSECEESILTFMAGNNESNGLPQFDPNDPPLNVWIPWDGSKEGGPTVNGHRLTSVYQGDARFADGTVCISVLSWHESWTLNVSGHGRIVAYRLTSKKS